MEKKQTQTDFVVYFILTFLCLSAVMLAVCFREKTLDAADTVRNAAQVSEECEYVAMTASRQRVLKYETLFMDRQEETDTAGSVQTSMEAGTEDAEGIQVSAGALTESGDNRYGIAEGDESYEILCRIVEAEAGCEDEVGRILVANVVLNRVVDSHFPDTVREVVFQYTGNTPQFSPVMDGSYDRALVSQKTREAVNKALSGVDYSDGALYFMARTYAAEGNVQWFDTHLKRLFSYGGHEFYM